MILKLGLNVLRGLILLYMIKDGREVMVGPVSVFISEQRLDHSDWLKRMMEAYASLEQ